MTSQLTYYIEHYNSTSARIVGNFKGYKTELEVRKAIISFMSKHPKSKFRIISL